MAMGYFFSVSIYKLHLEKLFQIFLNFRMFKLDLEKAEEKEIKLLTSVASLKSKRFPEKHLLLLY